MEKREGYRKTEIGWIPVDWNVEKFIDISENFDSQRVPIKSEERDAIKGEYPYYGARDY